MYTVYCHTNIYNSKRYVGITKFSMEKRWKEHVSQVKWGEPTVLGRAILKYGADAFAHEILETVPDLNSANEAEIWWIAHFASDDRSLGYNTSPGGTLKRMDPEARKKMSDAAKAREAALTPEEKTARALKGLAGLPPEVRSEVARKREAKRWASLRAQPKPRKRKRKQQPRMDPALAREHQRAGCIAREARKTPEERSAAVKKGHAKRTPEQRHAAAERLATHNRERRAGTDPAQLPLFDV